MVSKNGVRESTRTQQSGMSRRGFLKGTAGAGVVLGAGSLFPALTPRGADARSGRRGTEQRTIFFNRVIREGDIWLVTMK